MLLPYEVYQIPHPEEGDEAAMKVYRRYAFEPLEHIDKVDMSHYRCVYYGHTPASPSPKEMLERIYMQLNMNHPTDYHARSLSVSDVVKLDGTFYYCDSIGWQKLGGGHE